MGYDSLQRYTQVRVPSIAYISAGDCPLREGSQSKLSVRMQFFRVREPPLVYERPIPRNALRPVPGKGQRLSVGGDEACASENKVTRFRGGRLQRVRVKTISAFCSVEIHRKARNDVLFVVPMNLPNSSE